MSSIASALRADMPIRPYAMPIHVTPDFDDSRRRRHFHIASR
jgi:hypothetical protein